MGALNWRIALLVGAFAQWGVLGQSDTRSRTSSGTASGTTSGTTSVTASATVSETQSETKTASSPSPTITEDPFIGFVVAAATTKPIYCPDGEVFRTSGTYAACCATTDSSCAIPTGCDDNGVVFTKGVSSNCGPMECQTRKIFSTYGIGDPALMPLCANYGEVDLVYREVPTTSSLILPLTAGDSTGALSTRPGMMVTIVGANGYPEPTQIGGAHNSDGSSGESLSPTFVGAIVGSIFGTAAVVALLAVAFWYGRRQGRTRSSTRNHESDWKTRPETPSSWDGESNVSVAGTKRRYSSPSRNRPIQLSPLPRTRR